MGLFSSLTLVKAKKMVLPLHVDFFTSPYS